MLLFEFDSEQITPEQLSNLERYIDRLFASVGLDVNFTKHFKERLRDKRNGTPISVPELQRMFKKVHRQMHKGKDIIELGDEAQAVLKDLVSDINIPFVINWDDKNKEFDLVAKTIMRKKNFWSGDDILPLN